MPPGGSNLFILANAPYLSPACDWNEETAAYGERVLSVLEGHGITGLSQADVLQRYTPGISLTILSPTGGHLWDILQFSAADLLPPGEPLQGR